MRELTPASVRLSLFSFKGRMDAAMAHVDIVGRSLEYHWLEPDRPDAPTLVFLHEALGSVSQWRDFPARLTARLGAQALIYSRSGHGRSRPLAGPRGDDYLHIEALTVLPALLAHFEIRAPILFGHSDGASIALIHAAAAAVPVHALVLEASHAFVEEITLQGIRAAVADWETTTLASKLARYHDHAPSLFRAWQETWLSDQFRAWTIEPLLPKITCPVLVIQGENDQYGTPEQVSAILRGVTGPAEGHLLPNCGHSPHREQPERVMKLSESFLSRWSVSLGRAAAVTC